jgi:molybdopterin adenylyltransferase
MDIRFGVLTISDRSARGERVDASGPVIEQSLRTRGWSVVMSAVIPDDLDMIKENLIEWADSGGMDIILTTGGTGFAARDVTPEATLAVVERLAPGIPEAMRAESMKITPHAMLTRMAAGIRKNTLIINLPGSPKAAAENLHVIVPVLEHAVQLLQNSADAEQGHQRKSKLI